MADDDPYARLGVSRTASPDEIRGAFRTLAKRHHPDLNPGDKAAERTFKAISAANELLSDPEKRARFDRGEIDAEGQPRPERAFYRGFADAGGGGYGKARPSRGGTGGGERPMSEEELGDIMGAFFRQHRGEAAPSRGGDEAYRLEVEFLEAALGATRRLTLPDGRTLDVTIPAGLQDGQVLRLRGQGGSGIAGGPAGDALIEIVVRAHPYFRQEGRDIHLELPVTLSEAVLGARVAVPTPGGPVTLTIPKRSEAGAQLRLRGRGIPASGGQAAGDLYCTLRLVLGTVDERLEAFLAGWTPDHPVDPRKEMLS